MLKQKHFKTTLHTSHDSHLLCVCVCICVCVQLNESDFKALVVTDDSSVVLNQLRVDEQGTYRCSLQGRDGTVFYRVTYPLAGRVLRLHRRNSVRSFDSRGAKGVNSALFNDCH